MNSRSTFIAACVATLLGCAGARRIATPVRTAPHRETRTVTVHEGTELVAALSPDGRRIAFILLGQTWLMDAAGGKANAVTNVVDDPRQDRAIAWAPDSRRLAVWSTNGPQFRALAVATSATLRTWEGNRTFDPVWDRASDRVIAAEVRGDSTVFWGFPLESAQPTVRLSAIPHRITGLTVSLDSGTLAYARPVSPQSFSSTGTTNLWELDLATGQERRLTADSAVDNYPSYSPDGQWLAYISERSGSPQLWLLPRGGGKARPLTTRAEDLQMFKPSWLPDSRGVMFTAAGKIRIAPVDGGDERIVEFSADLQVARWHSLRRPEIPKPAAQRHVRGIVTPELSPDGREIAFAALGDLWVSNVVGGETRRLSRSAADESRPRWSPDGKRLAYVVSDPWAERHVEVIEVANPGRVFDTGIATARSEFDFQLAWSPDGQRLAFIDTGRVGWTDLRTRQTRVVAQATGGSFAGFQWSRLLGWTRGGDSIAFARARFEGGAGVWQTWQVSADSGPATAFHMPGEYSGAGSVGWHKDMRRIAFANSGRGYYVDLARPADSSRVPDAPTHDFSWSADGHALLYQSGTRLRLLDVERAAARTVTPEITYTVPRAPPPLVIRNVRIIDGTGAATSSPSDVLVIEGRIARISPRGREPASRGARELDGGGRALIPGLINMHVHLAAADLNLVPYLYHGVTTVREMGADPNWTLSVRERVEAGELLGPRIFATGGRIIAENQGLVGPGLRYANLEDPGTVAAEVESMASGGTDIVKPYFRKPALDSRVSAVAHAAGFPMTSHFVLLGSLAEGLEGKEHSDLQYRSQSAPYREDVVEALAAANTCITPTLHLRLSQRPQLDSSVFHDSAFALLYPAHVSEAGRARLRRPVNARTQAIQRQREEWDLFSMLKLHRAGVRVVTGTDVGPPFDEPGVLLETQLFVRAGFTPIEAIRAATLDAASCLGVEQELGSVEVGKRADLIIVDGDPATDIRDLRRIVWVVLGGAPHTRQELLSSIRRSGSH
jgi:Tol biopolymer transport system component